MKIEIDQSIRIEQLNRDSTIGFGAIKIAYAVLLPRKTKRYFNEQFRRQGKPRQCAPTVFGAAIVAGLQTLSAQAEVLVIDAEYRGYEVLIEDLIARFHPTARIEFRQLGRKSPAHLVAYAVFKKRRKPDRVLTKADLQAIIMPLNKTTAGEPHRHVLTQVRKPNQPVKKKYTQRKRYVNPEVETR